MFYCIIDSNFGRIFKYQISYVFGEKNSEFLKFIEISSQKVPKMIGIRPPWEVTPLWLSWTYLDTYQGFNRRGWLELWSFWIFENWSFWTIEISEKSIEIGFFIAFFRCNFAKYFLNSNLFFNEFKFSLKFLKFCKILHVQEIFAAFGAENWFFGRFFAQNLGLFGP